MKLGGNHSLRTMTAKVVFESIFTNDKTINKLEGKKAEEIWKNLRVAKKKINSENLINFIPKRSKPRLCTNQSQMYPEAKEMRG